jgi:hypothetical protein
MAHGKNSKNKAIANIAYDAHVNAVTKEINASTSDESKDQRRDAFKRAKTAFGL